MECLCYRCEFIFGNFVVTSLKIRPTHERVIKDFTGVIRIREVIPSLSIVVVIQPIQYECRDIE